MLAAVLAAAAGTASIRRSSRCGGGHDLGRRFGARYPGAAERSGGRRAGARADSGSAEWLAELAELRARRRCSPTRARVRGLLAVRRAGPTRAAALGPAGPAPGCRRLAGNCALPGVHLSE